jgi:hypothetical protein
LNEAVCVINILWGMIFTIVSEYTFYCMAEL